MFFTTEKRLALLRKTENTLEYGEKVVEHIFY